MESLNTVPIQILSYMTQECQIDSLILDLKVVVDLQLELLIFTSFFSFSFISLKQFKWGF